MHGSAVAACVAGCLLVAGAAEAATPVHRCVIDGTVTFQRDPCPTGKARKQPTAQQLNAERKRRQETESAASAAAAGTGPGGEPRAPATSAGGSADRRGSDRSRPPAAAAPYRCDGRTHCSQMTSCDEAKYFLRHCPGVRMDGDGDGVPCETQWCGR